MSFFGFLRRLFGGAPGAAPRRGDGPRPKRTAGGSEILRHSERKRPLQLGAQAGDDAEAIEKHVEAHVGPVATVFHELISDLVHLDVLIVAPQPKRNYWTLVTSGMSDLPMTVPPGMEAARHAELVVCLPPTWPMSDPQFKERRNYWPVHWLKFLARLPHEHDTWLADGHTIPNGDPAAPLHEGVPFTGWLLSLPRRFGAKFISLEISPEKTVFFWALFPLTSDEMDFKLARGSDELNERLDEAGVTELLDPGRASVV
jgi:hypothetical protein